MNLYLLTQDTVRGYDTYDSCVVCAESEEEAQKIVPCSYYQYTDGVLCNTINGRPVDEYSLGWPSHQSEVKVKLIGIAEPSVEKGVVGAYYNAG